MSKPVLVLVMSDMCGACQNFKRKLLPDLERELKRDSRFNFIVLNFPEMAIPSNGKDFHPELKNGFVEFFPTFILFPGHLWNNRNSKLQGVPKHSMKNNPKVDYSKSSILSWVNDTINNNPMFNSSTGNMGSLARPLGDDRYAVPTYGTYNLYQSTKADREFDV